MIAVFQGTAAGEISSEVLIIAPEGRIERSGKDSFKNDVKRASELLQDDSGSQRPGAISEVESAQKKFRHCPPVLADAGENCVGWQGRRGGNI